MADFATNFISQFHNLQGETVKEKHNSLFKLFRENHWLKNDPTKLNLVVENLHPNNHLEKIFRTDFLIHFQRVEELYQDFKRGDEITIRKVAKHHWFYETVFKDVTCDDLINTILPSSSYSLKTTILKRIPLDEVQADSFFEAVLKHYNLPLATLLLSKCSTFKIKDTLKKHPVKLTVAQLQAIFDKDPSLISVYLEEKREQNGDSNFINNNPILIHIAQKNPKLFSEMFKEHNFKVALGRRTTKKYIAEQKGEILKDKGAYIHILNKGATVRKLGTEMTDTFFDKKDNEMNWKSMLKFYPTNQQFEVLKSSYNKLFHFKFGEKVEDISEKELSLIPVQQRQEIALRKKLQDEDDKYLKYVTPEFCLKELMEKLKYTTVEKRVTLIEHATFCGFLNNDVELLAKVCELVAVRLKNDDRNLRWGFSIILHQNKDKLKIFDERHWKFINDIIAASKANNEHFFENDLLVAFYLKYLVKNNKSVKDVVRNIAYVDDISQYFDSKKDAHTFKVMLVELLEQGFQKKDDEENEFKAASYDCELTYYCKLYNEKNPDSTIDVFKSPRIMTSVRYLLDSAEDKYLSSSLLSGLEYILCRKLPDLEPLKALYFSNFKIYGRRSGLLWFLKNEPSVLSRYFDDFLNGFFNTRGTNTKRFWKSVKKCSHLDLDKRTLDFCRQKLSEEGYCHKVKLIRALSILTPTESHLEFIKKYKPLSDKVDLTDDDASALYKIQEKVVRFLHYSGASRQVLEATFDFCKGDYLKFALSPLYCCFYKLPENETREYMQKLESVKALSVKKHATVLSCVIYGQNEAKKCLVKSDVPTFLTAMKYFAKTSSDDLWLLVESKLQKLDKNELLLLKVALKIQIPPQYKSRFVETTWKLLDKHQDNEITNLLIAKIDKNTVRRFSSDFALKTVKESIFKVKNADSVVSNIVIFCDVPGKFSLLSKIFSHLKTLWKQPKLQGLARQKLASFIQTLFTIYMKNDEVNEEFVTEMTSVFTSNFSFIDAFDEMVAMRFMAWKNKIDDCAKGLIRLNQEICAAFGSYAVHLLVKSLTTFILKHVFCKNDERIKLCHSLFKFKETNNDWLLILGLLPHNLPQYEEPFVLYEEILRALEEVTDDLVQLQKSAFLMSSSHKESDWEFSCDGL